MPKTHTPTWSRKPDQRPFANVIIKGKRRRISLLRPDDRTIPSDAECERRLNAIVANLLPTLKGKPDDPRLISSIFDWYVETVMPARGYKPVTQQANRVIFRTWAAALAKYGCRNCEDLAKNPGVMDAIVAEMAKTRKGSTIWRDVSKVKAAFEHAAKRKLIPAVPLTEWPRPKTRPREFNEMATAKQVGQFLARVDKGVYGPVTRFIAYVGCRPVDACELTVDRIHGAEAVFRQHKTGQPVIIPLAREAAAVVRQAIGKRTAGRVFLSRGKPVNPNHLCVALRRFGESFDPPITAKTLRQFVVSTLLDLGYDVETVRRMTGHRSDAIWAYRQLRGANVRKAAESIAGQLKKGARTNGHPRKKSNKV